MFIRNGNRDIDRYICGRKLEHRLRENVQTSHRLPYSNWTRDFLLCNDSTNHYANLQSIWHAKNYNLMSIDYSYTTNMSRNTLWCKHLVVATLIIPLQTHWCCFSCDRSCTKLMCCLICVTRPNFAEWKQLLQCKSKWLWKEAVKHLMKLLSVLVVPDCL